jgi:tetratricopeptide (TPR) repeat protein
MGLLLQAVDVAGSLPVPLRWRWRLTDEGTGEVLAEHLVDLDAGCAELAMVRDLYGYVRWHAAPDRRAADEARIVSQVGEWAGRVLLGEKVGAAIVAAAPVTVRVAIPARAALAGGQSAEAPPAGAGEMLQWPLELAHVDGEPLAGRGDVSFVYDIAPDGTARAKAGVSGALRVLAVFSLPSQLSVVALRRARFELSRLIRRIAAREGAAVELRVVQYGVTRERLAKIADSGDGWDVLQLWGHGGPGVFVLEHADGSPDPVDTSELVALLRPLRQRVKLAVVSACESAAAATAETLRLIGLEDRAAHLEQEPERERDETAPAAGVMGVARALVTGLDCAVVGMRYPVTDEFAIAFGGEFYERLLQRGQPVDVAVARAVAKAKGVLGSVATVGGVLGSVELATPGMFGARAAGLRLSVPHGDPVIDPAKVRMERFPPEPERFVGRAAAMAAASAALAPDSGCTAVLLHGMAGAGKTACALELAYRHQDGFAAAAFWQAPTKDDEFGGALAGLAVALEAQLGRYGFAMTGHIGTPEALDAFLPRLRQVMQDSGVLLVLDNLETLLTPQGTWRDPRWGPLIGALAGHGGESRLIMTSRIPTAGLGPHVLVLPVHALSLGEAATLARELPHLRRLLHIDPGPAYAQAESDVDRDRERVRRVLRVVQGHPKLLELADAAAADPGQLDAQLAAAESANAGHGLDAFFRDGTSSLDPDQFLAALSGWTTTALAVLPVAARLLVEFLACIEDDDRQRAVIDGNWADLWRRLGRPDDLPDPGPLLEVLAAAALIQPESSLTASEGSEQPADGAMQASVRYRMHPGVAAAVHDTAESEVRDAADAELAAFWRAVADEARQREGGEDTALVVRAGLAAAPYLLRRRDWDTASTLLEYAVVRDGSPGVIQAALPALRRVAETTHAPVDYGVLACALRTVDSAEAERLLRDALRAAVGSDDYRLASAAAGELVNLLGDAARLGEALDLAGQKAGYTRQAGLGPWTQLADRGRRLQILGWMGEHEQVLAETGVLRDQMGELPARPAGNETARPWNVREVILGIGRSSALALGRWQQCLDLNAEITASKRQRGAGIHEITRTRYNDAGPLIRLGRLEEAGLLLRECQQVFEDHADTTMLARVLSSRAHLEDKLGHRDAAVDLGRIAIRLCYGRPEPRDIAISHHNLANHLARAGGDLAGQRAHRLAAALIQQLTGMTHDLARTRRALATELRQDSAGGTGQLPATPAEVIRVAEETDGVRLGELISALGPDPAAVEAALAQILRDAAELPPYDEAAIARHLEEWEPDISAMVSACRGDQDAAAQLLPALDNFAKDPDWAALVGVLRRILDGERGGGLLEGLDAVDTAIAGEVLGRLGTVGEEGSG